MSERLGRLTTRWYAGLLLLLLALLPRVWPPAGGFMNPDAAGVWLTRAKLFLSALMQGPIDQLAQSGHPGVTLMWLTGVTDWLLHQFAFESWFADPLIGYFTVLKLPLALVTSALVVLAWWLLRKIIRPWLAFAMAGLFAIDPLYLVYSRYLHLDALVTGLVLTALLAHWILVRTNARWAAVLSGTLFALTILTRFNAAIAIAFAMMVWPFFTTQPWRVWRSRLVIWLLAFVGTIILVWPVTLLDPGRIIEVGTLGLKLGLSDHEIPPHLDVHPLVRLLLFPLFIVNGEFPVIVFLAVIGTVTLIRAKATPERNFFLYMFAFGVIFFVSAIMTPKQLARYILPAIGGLIPTAVFGGAWLIEKFSMQRRWLLGALGLILVLQLGIFWRLGPWYQLYESSIARVLIKTPLGSSEAFEPTWGEGLREAAEYLDVLPGPFPTTASWLPAVPCIYSQPRDQSHYPLALKPIFSCEQPITFLKFASQTEYIVLSRDAIRQRYFSPLVEDIERLGWKPEKIISIRNVPLVWIYRNAGGLRPEYQP